MNTHGESWDESYTRNAPAEYRGSPVDGETYISVGSRKTTGNDTTTKGLGWRDSIVKPEAQENIVTVEDPLKKLISGNWIC